MGNKENRQKTYSDGMRDAIQLWGRVCGKQNACDDCPILPLRSAGMTCQQFAQKFPNKFIPMLIEMDKGNTTYYSEFCARFPECTLDLELLSELTCRKAIFEGVTTCDNSMSCAECWMQKYEGDITDFNDVKDSDMVATAESADILPEALRD